MRVAVTGLNHRSASLAAREALALTREVRDYLRDYGEVDSRDLAVETAAHYSLETMRLTSRLTNMMTWLLVQRAVHRGDLVVC